MSKRTPSPTEDRIRIHYKRIGLADGWSKDRVMRLCKLLRITPQELCALCNCRKENWADCMCYGKFTGPLTLHFALIESAFIAMTTGHVGDPIMPAIQK